MSKFVNQLFLSLLIICPIGIASVAQADTTVGSDITSSTIWTTVGSPYIITNNISIINNARLTIKPGVIVKFNSGFSLNVGNSSAGYLDARGTAALPIRFTSSAVSPAPGNWGSINFLNQADASQSFLDYVIVEYAGSGATSAITTYVPVPITNSTIQNNAGNGIKVYKGSSNITDNQFLNNTGAAVEIALNSSYVVSPVLHNNIYTNNGSNNAIMISGQFIYYSALWTKDNTPYLVTNSIIVRNGGKLTIEPGVIIRFNSQKYLTIADSGVASLDARGTTTQPITFTSTAAVPAAGDWGGIIFYSTTDTNQSFIDNVIVEYAGYSGSSAVSLNVPVSVTNSIIRNNAANGVNVYKGSPNITNNQFTSNAGAAVEVALSFSYGLSPVLRNNSYLTNGFGNSIKISGNFIYYSTIWTKDNTSYLVIDNITVRNNATLKIEPGVTIKFNPNVYLTVGDTPSGYLDARGTSAQPILFTSAALNPTPTDWAGIYFYNQPDVGQSFLDYVIVEYAGQGNGGITVNSHAQQFSITNSIIRNNRNGIYLSGTFSGNITNNSFINNTLNPIVIDYNAPGSTAPILRNNIYTNNGSNGIKISVNYLNYNTTWTKDNTFYETAGFRIYAGPVGQVAVLTIEPGVEVRLAANAIIDVTTNGGGVGGLNATGTAAQPIKFTSLAQPGTKGSWGGIAVIGLPTDNPTNFDHVIIENAGQTNILNAALSFYSASITYASKTISVTNSIITNSSTEGISMYESSPRLIGNTITNNNIGISVRSHVYKPSPVILNNTITLNTNYGIFVDGNELYYPNPKINNNRILNNTNYNVYASGGGFGATQRIDAKYNWWGSTDSQIIAAKIYDRNDVPGSALPIVDFIPYLYGETVLISNVAVTPKIINTQNNQTTSINYTLDVDSNITMKVYNFSSNELVRTLLNNVAKTQGNQSQLFDGRNDSGQLLTDDIYYFTIEVRDNQGQLIGGYFSNDVVSVAPTTATLAPSFIDPYKGDVAKINYSLAQDSIVGITIGSLGGNPLRTLFSNKFRSASANQDIWDGRLDNGTLVNSPNAYVAGIFATSLPDNSIVIKTNSTLSIDSIRSDPFIFRPSYSEVSDISYTISGEDARVTVGIESSNGTLVYNLVNNELKSPGTYTVRWNGKNGPLDSDKTVNKDNYRVKVTAIGNVSGVTIEQRGNLGVF